MERGYDATQKNLTPDIVPTNSVAFMVQILLKMDRPDLARQQLAALKSFAEDASIAQLAEAWVNLYMVIFCRSGAFCQEPDGSRLDEGRGPEISGGLLHFRGIGRQCIGKNPYGTSCLPIASGEVRRGRAIIAGGIEQGPERPGSARQPHRLLPPRRQTR